jgi:glycosyltransferase involved in cell wall biosynthesis
MPNLTIAENLYIERRREEFELQPVITVLIRTYNSETTIGTAIQSAINQTLSKSKYMILVVDDGSTDGSLEVIKEYNQVTVISSPHRGSIGALNLGLDNIDTQYVIYLDSDDWFEPTILKSMYHVLREHPNLDFVYCDYYEVVGNSIQVVSVKDNIFNTLAAGIMFSTILFKHYGQYDDTLIFPEYDLLIKMLPSTTRHHIAEPMYNYVRNPQSITADKSLVERGRKQLFEKYDREYSIRDY